MVQFGRPQLTVRQNDRTSGGSWTKIVAGIAITVLVVSFALLNSSKNYNYNAMATYVQASDVQEKSSTASCDDDRFSLARSQSYGFFDDIADENWKLLNKIYVEHKNHKYMNAPLTHNPAFDKRKVKYFNSNPAWYQTVS
jgi:uncharacterized protein YxeA